MWAAAVLSLLWHASVVQCSGEAVKKVDTVAELRRPTASDVQTMKTRVAELEGVLHKERSDEKRLTEKISLLETGLGEVEPASQRNSADVATGKMAIVDGFADGHLHLQFKAGDKTSLLQQKGGDPDSQPTGSDIFKGAEEESERMEKESDLVNDQLLNVKTMIKYNEELKKKLEGDLHVLTVMAEADKEAIKIAKKGEEQSILNVATSIKDAAEAAKAKLEENADEETKEDEKEAKEEEKEEEQELTDALKEEDEKNKKAPKEEDEMNKAGAKTAPAESDKKAEGKQPAAEGGATS